MRITQLLLKAIGPFTNAALDLSGGQYGIHFVLGPNEAGKTSTMRALGYAFFGFPHKVTDNFKHEKKNLRVGATLLSSDNTTIEFLRSKRAKNSVVQPDDKTVIPDQTLQEFLGEINQETFERFFCLGHEELIQGGQEILAGDGDAAQILFTATGLGNIQSVRDKLTEDRDALFLPSGKKPVVNQLTSQYNETERNRKKLELSQTQWNKTLKELAAAEKSRDELDTVIAQKSAVRNRLERLRQAIPTISKRDVARKTLEDAGPAPVLSPNFSERRESASASQRKAESRVEHAQSTVSKLETELQETTVSEQLLSFTAQIENTISRLSVQQKARSDRPAIEALANSKQVELDNLLKELETADAESDLEKLHVSKADRVRIAELGEGYHALRTRTETLTSELSDKRLQLEEATEKIAQASTPLKPASLKVELEAALALGDLEDRIADTDEEREQLRSNLENSFSRLSLWQQSQTELLQAALPSTELVERFLNELTVSQQEIDLQAERRQISDDRVTQQKTELDKLIAEHNVPTESDLDALRQTRDAAWQAFSQTNGSSDPKEAADKPTHTDVDKLIYECDELADRLRREADRVAQRTEKEAALKAESETQTRTEGALSELKLRRTELIERWNATWAPFEVQPLPPVEMLAWLRKTQAIHDQADRLKETEIQAKKLAKQLTAKQKSLATALEPWDCGSESSHSLANLIAFAKTCIEQSESMTATRATLESNAQQLSADVTRLESQQSQNTTEFAQWQADWNAVIKPLPIRSDAKPNEADEVLNVVQSLSHTGQQLASEQSRLTAIDSDSKQFYADAQQLLIAATDYSAAETATPQLAAPQSIEQALAKLLQDSRQAAESKRNQDKLHAQLAEAKNDLEQTKQVLREANLELAELCTEAQCDSPGELRKVEEHAIVVKQLQDKCAEHDNHLLDLAAGSDLATLESAAAETNFDELPAAIEALDAEIATATSSLEEAKRTVWEKEREKSDFGTEGTATAILEQQRDRLSQIANSASEYARLHLAIVLLNRSTDRYLQKHQGPVLRRASELFAELTCNSFEGLCEDYDGQGRAVIQGIRNGGSERLTADQMSAGTADQLFLAIRIAWIESYLERNEPIPFIVDDILIQFDNQRSAAVLRVLEKLSKKTQVIFFTHHDHILDLAKNCLNEGTWFTHAINWRDDDDVSVERVTAKDSEFTLKN